MIYIYIYSHQRRATAGLTGDAESDEGGWSGRSRRSPGNFIHGKSMGNLMEKAFLFA